MSVATKVALQISSKLGSAPWTFKMPKNMMAIGYDVSHDTRDKSLSYGALVATMGTENKMSFFSAVSPHRNGEELSNELALNVNKALRSYKAIHNDYPEKIIFFRDGVGDGQVS
jgi:aubergine